MIRERHPRVAHNRFHLEAAHESRDRLLRAGVAAPEGGDVNAQGLTQTTSTPVSLASGGSPLPRLRSRKCSLAPPCGRAWIPQTEL